jgi:hypothetical protein
MPHLLAAIAAFVFGLTFLTPKQAGATVAAAATSSECTPSGSYFCPYWTPAWRPLAALFELHGPFAGLRRCTPHSAVGDTEAGRTLWQSTASFCGL